jgi:anti-anti-sigma factor
MTSTVIPAPAIPLYPTATRMTPGPTAPVLTDPTPFTAPDPATPNTRTPASGLPVARVADPDEYGSPLTITVDDRGRSAVLRVRGEIDLLTSADLAAVLDEWLASGAGTVVVDLRDVWFVDCAGMGLLADARCRADRAGIRLRIVAGRAVGRTAALLDLTDALGLATR